jgi:hypothetical protein
MDRRMLGYDSTSVNGVSTSMSLSDGKSRGIQTTRLKIEKCEVCLPGRKVREDSRMLRCDVESFYLCRGVYALLSFLERNRLATAS